MADNTLSRFTNLLRNHTSMPIGPLSRLVPDLGLDSLDIVQIELDIETEFGIQFAYDPNTMETVEDVAKGIDAVLDSARAKSAQSSTASASASAN